MTYHKSTFSAANSKQLLAAVEQFNAANPDDPLHVSWGREGSTSMWYAHDIYGSNLKTGLRFYEVVAYVNEAIEMREFADEVRNTA